VIAQIVMFQSFEVFMRRVARPCQLCLPRSRAFPALAQASLDECPVAAPVRSFPAPLLDHSSILRTGTSQLPHFVYRLAGTFDSLCIVNDGLRRAFAR
jgi:hypothetical protein